MTERILRVNVQTSGNALVFNTCNDFNGMNCPTIQPISLDDNGKLKYRSQGGLVGIYTEETLDKIIAGLEFLRPHVKKYEAKRALEASQKQEKKSEQEKAKVDSKALEKALQTLIAIGHTEEEARKILKLDQEKEEAAADLLPEDLRITLQVLLDRGIPREEAYKKLGLTKAGKVDKRRKG